MTVYEHITFLKINLRCLAEARITLLVAPFLDCVRNILHFFILASSKIAVLSENDKYLACISGNRGWNGRSNGTNCLLQIKIS